MFIAILGRQPQLGIAELERQFSDVSWFSDQSAIVATDQLNIERLGGTLKAGRVVAELPSGDWRKASMKIVQAYAKAWADFDGKLTLGISAYDFPVSAREVQKTGIILKGKLKQSGVSLRLIPNTESALNTATSHHNKLGLANNKVELLVVRGKSGKIIIAESIGAQNITALAKRDQERPKRDAFVGMLPPKLAQIMINLVGPLHPSQGEAQARVLDPFCGTGVVLQEAALLSHAVYGTDLSEKMIRYSRDNLNWLQDTFLIRTGWYLHEGDAMTTKWQRPINAVVCEAYLGQPFSAPPSPAKLAEVRGNCDHIISAFLKNIGPQLAAGTPLCIAVPAWRSTNGSFTHLPLINKLDQLGYSQIQFKNVRTTELLYYREDQIVARELLVLTKK
jgi:tRNA G10  N-methylase Trm11